MKRLTPIIKKNLTYLTWITAVLFFISSFFISPNFASAEETCCLCTMSSDTSSGSTCFKIDSTKLKEPNNCKTFASETGIDNQWTCTRKLGANECQPILSGGACALGPQTVVPEAKGEAVQSSSGGATASADTSDALVDFNVDIPGFVTPTDQSLLLGAYVAAIYRYSLSIVTILATVMFIWGAFLYLVGSSTGKISKGKEIMTDAIIGMILLFSANLILRTLNPALVTFKSLDITQIKTIPLGGLIGIEYSPRILTELGEPPRSTATSIPTYGIPGACPGRDTRLTQETINGYLKQQQTDGVPAAVVIAQIANETNTCAAVYLFTPEKLAKCSYTAKYYNFGGRNCTAKLPNTTCGFLALPGSDKENKSASYDVNFVNTHWNSKQKNASVCTKLSGTYSASDFKTYECGDSCFPVSTYTSFLVDGKKSSPPAIQCLQKMNSVQEFLTDHNRIVKPCLPYNDSVYDFAYCVGLSNYAGSYLKAKVLADYIEKNCLCDPEKDAKKCIRDKKLESEITSAHIKKMNLLLLRSKGGTSADPVVEALWKATGGALYPGPSDAMDEKYLTPSEE